MDVDAALEAIRKYEESISGYNREIKLLLDIFSARRSLHRVVKCISSDDCTLSYLESTLDKKELSAALGLLSHPE